MSEQIRETWLQKIRDIASLIEKAEYESLKSDADVKRVLAVLKTKALGEGIKTTSAQDTWLRINQNCTRQGCYTLRTKHYLQD